MIGELGRFGLWPPGIAAAPLPADVPVDGAFALVVGATFEGVSAHAVSAAASSAPAEKRPVAPPGLVPASQMPLRPAAEPVASDPAGGAAEGAARWAAVGSEGASAPDDDQSAGSDKASRETPAGGADSAVLALADTTAPALPPAVSPAIMPVPVLPPHPPTAEGSVSARHGDSTEPAPPSTGGSDHAGKWAAGTTITGTRAPIMPLADSSSGADGVPTPLGAPPGGPEHGTTGAGTPTGPGLSGSAPLPSAPATRGASEIAEPLLLRVPTEAGAAIGAELPAAAAGARQDVTEFPVRTASAAASVETALLTDPLRRSAPVGSSAVTETTAQAPALAQQEALSSDSRPRDTAPLSPVVDAPAMAEVGHCPRPSHANGSGFQDAATPTKAIAVSLPPQEAGAPVAALSPQPDAPNSRVTPMRQAMLRWPPQVSALPELAAPEPQGVLPGQWAGRGNLIATAISTAPAPLRQRAAPEPAPAALRDETAPAILPADTFAGQSAPSTSPDHPASPQAPFGRAAGPAPAAPDDLRAPTRNANVAQPTLADPGERPADARPTRPAAEKGRRVLPAAGIAGPGSAASLLPGQGLPPADRPAQALPATGIAALPTPLATATSLPDLAVRLRPHLPSGAAGQVELILAPDDLGGLRFRISRHGDSLSVVLAAERPETLDFLRRNVDQLAQELRQSGCAGASISFSQWDQQGSRGHQGPPVPLRSEKLPADAVAPAPSSPLAALIATSLHPALSRHGLNLRL